MRSNLIPGAFLLICIMMLTACDNAELTAELPKEQKSASQLYLQDSLGKLKNVIDSSLKINLVVFWASWCKPCIQEIPELKKLHSNFADRSFKMVSISTDSDPENWKAALSQQKMPWQQLLVTSNTKHDLKETFDVPALPCLFIVDQHGKILHRTLGYNPRGLKFEEHFIDSLIK